jgi:hypothetical protein
MDQPTQQRYDPERKITLLRFGRDDDERNGEYYLRGGVCWPVAVRQSDGRSASGHVVMVGFNLTTKKYIVFEDRDFVCVDPVVENNRIMFNGAADWFNLCWAQYFCRYWYYHQDETTHRTYLMQTIRSEMIQPKPGFIELPWTDENAVVPVFWQLISTKRIDGLSQAIVKQAGQLQGTLGKSDLGMYPAVHALVCALAGMERWPWRERE